MYKSSPIFHFHSKKKQKHCRKWTHTHPLKGQKIKLISTVLFCGRNISAEIYSAVLCCAVLYCAVLCCAVLCCAVLCCAVLCCAVLCYAVLCYAVLCCAVLCCTRRIRIPRNVCVPEVQYVHEFGVFDCTLHEVIYVSVQR